MRVAAAEDDRTTRVGRFIRKVRIDELPQFINILRGEMSFVGPRPERPFFVEQLTQLIPFYSQRHLVEPGLTGWAQIKGGRELTVSDKAALDIWHVRHASLRLDLRILFGTRFIGAANTIYGLLLILFIIFMPRGIVGLLRGLATRRERRTPVPAA